MYNKANEKNKSVLKRNIFGIAIILVIIGLVSFVILGKVRNNSQQVEVSSIKVLEESYDMGNLSANYNPLAYLITSENNIFYPTTEGLVKAKKDNTEQEILTSDDGINLNKINDDIYYIDNSNVIKKVNVKTKKNSIVSEEKIKKFIILGEKIYYLGKEDNNVYEMNILGKENKKIINKKVYNFSLSKTNMLYLNDEGLFLIDLNSSKEQNLNEDVDRFALYDNCILYIKDNVIYKSTLDMKNKEKIVSDVDSFTASKEWVYYINTKKQLRAVKIDGEKDQEVEGLKDINIVNISNGVGYAIDNNNKIKYFRAN